MRKNAESAFIKVAFVIIVVVFIFWGVGGMVKGEKPDAIARVNDRVITPQEFDRAYRNISEVYKRQGISPEILAGLRIHQQVLDELVKASLIRQEADRLGLEASDDEVREAIRTAMAMPDAGGFNRERYVSILRANGLTPTEFEDTQREELLVRKVQGLVTAGVHVSDAEVRQQYDYDNEKVILSYVKFDAASMLDQATVTDEELTTYYQAHQEAYREPERVRVELLTYTPALLAGSVTVDDAAIQDFYKEHSFEYQLPEQVHARHILFKVAADADAATKEAKRSQAEAILARAKGGEDFASLATQYSEDTANADKGGDLGMIRRNQTVKPIEDAAFALEPGQVSDVIESQFGFEIVKVESKDAAREQTLDEAREQIVSRVRQEKADAARRERAVADQQRARSGTAFDALAKEIGTTVTAAGPLARGDAIAGVTQAPDLSTKMFTTPDGEVGEVVDAADASYLFRLVERIPSRLPELTEVRAQALEAARKDKAQTLARTKATTILERLKASPDLNAVAASESLSVKETGAFRRADTTIPELGAATDLKTDAFNLSTEQRVAQRVYDLDGDSVVAVLKERVPADDAGFAQQKETLKTQLQERRKRTVVEDFVNQLKARSDIHIQPDFIASLDEGAAPRRRR